MNSEEKITKGAPRKLWKRLFIGLLLLQAILELGVGGVFLFNFPLALESGFGITYSPELDILGMALGLYLLLLTTLLILSSIWTSRSNRAGIILGIICGVFLVSFGVVSFIKFGDPQGLLVDSIRGLITIVFGYLAGKEL